MADLLSRYGFVKEAETAYKAFIARDPKQPERVLALAQFLARQDRVAEAMEILKKAWSTCRPEQVAIAALLALRRPVGGGGPEAAGRSLGMPRPSRSGPTRSPRVQTRGDLDPPRSV